MRLMDRYLIREMLGPAVGALLAFVVLIIGHVLFTVVDVVAGKGIRLESVMHFAALKAPEAAILALPVATLLGCALALNRLASDNELTPLMAGGVSGYRLMRPALLLGLTATVFSFAIKEFAVPAADQQAEAMYRQMLLRQKSLVFKPGTFVDSGGRWVFVARDVDRDTDTLYGVRGILRQPGGFPWLMFAPKARFQGRRLVAQQARFYGFAFPDSVDSLYGDLDVDLNELSGYVTSGAVTGNRSLSVLLTERAARLEGGARDVREYDLEIHSRLSLIVACLAFSFLAAPVALRFGRGQSLAGVLATLVVAFIYYVVMLGLKILGGNGVLPVPVAAWAQNVAVIAGSLWAMRRF